MIFHSGSLDGSNTVLGFLPEHEIGIIVLANTHNYSASLLMAEFFDLYLNIPLKDWNTLLIEMQKAELQKTTVKKGESAAQILIMMLLQKLRATFDHLNASFFYDAQRTVFQFFFLQFLEPKHVGLLD